jgi:ABC-type multidrug transport system ATPase subunit
MNPTHALVLETHNLSKANKKVLALKHLNLKVKQHSIVGWRFTYE